MTKSSLRSSRCCCTSIFYVCLGMMIGTVFTLMSLDIPSFTDSKRLSSHPLSKRIFSDVDLPSAQRSKEHPCLYPISTLVTPSDSYCDGASGLYGSIVRTVIGETVSPGSVCVHFMYVDQNISVEEMYRWEEKVNPYSNINGCRELINEKMNALVPVSWYPIPTLILPPWAKPDRSEWIAAINKIHVWAFDRFERTFFLDLDIVVLRQLTKIFDETPLIYDIVGGMDGWLGCNDRYSINGGAILIKGTRYFHHIAMQMIEDRNTTCSSRRWAQGDQELLNCICGLQGSRRHRPEFQCSLLPVYNHIIPSGYKCHDATARPWRLVHFVGVSKPWERDVDRTKGPERAFWWCIKDAMSKTIDDLMRCEPFSL